MSPNYVASHASALRQVKAAGASVTFTKASRTRDPETGQSTKSTATVTGHAVRVSGRPDRYQALGLIESKAPTLMFVPATRGELPEPGSEVTWGGEDHTVRDVEPVAPDGTAIAARIIAER